MEDLRCYTLHFYFKVIGAEIYNGEVGYATSKMGECTGLGENTSIEKFNSISEAYRKIVAETLKVPLENVTQISRDEYHENTDNDDE